MHVLTAETSNRQNTRDRAKIVKKVAEHKRKTKRNAKKDQTWKSSAWTSFGSRNQLTIQKRSLN